MEITGGVTTYVNDHGAPVNKDDIVKKLIPNNISECALYLNKDPGEPCMSDSVIDSVSHALNIHGSPNEIITLAKERLDCENERCVLGRLTSEIGPERVKNEINSNLKVKGPTDNKLLSNVHVDSVLKQWMGVYHNFFAYNFNMLNYASYSWNKGYTVNKPDTLATIQFDSLYNGSHNGNKYNCAACIINSDTYQGEGKHWMALFADARGDKVWTVEFFNSSGNAPAPEWVNWMVKTKNYMEQIVEKSGKKIQIELMKVSNIRHQQSRSECGLYSLFYIWARLHKIPVEYFLENPIPDQLMFEFRQHLFEDPKRKTLKKFNWNEYKNSVKIEWE